MSTVRPARTVVVRIKGPQGPSGTANLGTVTVVDPDQNPAITATGTLRDRIFNFVLPRAAAFSVGSVAAGVNALDADVTDSGVDGDVSLDFTLPRSEISVGTVTEVNPNVTPAVSATTTNGDVALNFDLPAAAAFTVPAAAVVNPDVDPSVVATETDGNYSVQFDLPRAPNFTVGTVTAGTDSTDAAVTDVGTDGDVSLNFTVPRTSLNVGTTTAANPDQNPAVTNSGTTGDAVFDFSLPRAPTFTVGTVTTVNPDVPAAVTNVGTDGDIVLDVDIPQGNTGDVGAGLPPTNASDEGKTIFVTSTGSTELRIPDTDDVVEGGNLYYTDARAQDAAPVQSVNTATGDVVLGTDDIFEGTGNLYYTDARVQDIAAPLLLVENVQTVNYTLELSDVAKVVAVDSGSALTVTVPSNASVAFPVGSVVNVYRAGSGGVDLVGASGVTVRNVGAISEQFGEVSLRKRGSDEWVLVGQVD